MMIIFLPNTKIILVIVKLMNILDAEEMAQVQEQLLQTPTYPPYTFLPPESSLISILQTFSSSFLSPPTPQIQEQTLRMVSSARNIRVIKKDDPNASIKTFSYSVFAIIFPLGGSNQDQKPIANDLLLETLKCSLYSKDLNFNHIRNKNLKVDNLQGKTMMAKFFSTLMSQTQCSNADKIRYIQWSFQRNQVLEELFILFFRIILSKLQVEGADDYSCPLSFSETITNLIEYFDINYRNFGEFFLISEESQFLASVNGYFVLGQYMENGGYINKQSSNIMNAVATHEVSGHSSSKLQDHKKNGVFQKDIKLFNFILESGRESHIMNDKDTDMETPHFKDSHEFAFGRKRKDQEQVARQEELKKEFQKFFMSSEAESVEEGELENVPAGQLLPTYHELIGVLLKQSEELETRPRNHTDQSEQLPQNDPPFLKKSTFNQSLIHELQDEVIDQPKINPQTHHKNMVSVKDKNITTFSPQISNHLKYQGFSSFVNDAVFLDQEANPDLFKSSSGENVQNPFSHYNGCKCMENRRKRNKIMSKVVDFSYFQVKTQRPKFLQNLKYSQNISSNSPKLKAFPKQSLNLRQDPSNKDIRKPSFLKFLKKQKQRCDKSFSSKSKSKSKKSIKEVGPSLYKDRSCFQLDKDTMNRINDKCTAFSTIISKNQLDINGKFPAAKSATKRNESSSLTKRSPIKQSTIKNFDSKYLNERPGLGSTWRLNEHFSHPSNNLERQKSNPPGMIQTSRNQNVRVYAPVNIIAPTVYFNGITQRDNRVIFTVNNTGDRQQELGLKMSERRLRTETGYTPTHPTLGFMGKPHQRNK